MRNGILRKVNQFMFLVLTLMLSANMLLGQETLLIEGKDIWVREKPKTGKVVMKLNEGDVCMVLQKSDAQVIRGRRDFWYYIDFNGKKGWVFGSQTSIKQKASLHNFQPFLKYFLEISFFNKDINILIRDKSPKVTQFVKKEIGVHRLFNPGSTCVLDSFESYIPVFLPIDPLTLFKNQSPKDGFCDDSKDADGVYYSKIDEFPYFYDMEKDTTGQIDIPEKYHESEKIKVDILKYKNIIKTMYFMTADDKWSLVLIDDCDCSA
ncbi:SH3 domain-containing protein [uncultured Aquimarina sp.]|uniref:SH3 domain-containing protein n=1 Tax=uncultured Aquimarina sp. TaxID=575652 RepID=UPI002603D2E3|nr:SH3 domain-containing protein [uncultured Aquimarina sp.]